MSVLWIPAVEGVEAMSKATILIVEDEAIVAADLASKLKNLDCDVVGMAAEAEEAVALACRLRPQLVLMDISLRGPLDGIAAADAIHSEYDVPVIYLTAHSDAATLARAKITGPFGYILKPFEDRELVIQIELALSQVSHRTRTSAAARVAASHAHEHWRRCRGDRCNWPDYVCQSRGRNAHRLVR